MTLRIRPVWLGATQIPLRHPDQKFDSRRPPQTFNNNSSPAALYQPAVTMSARQAATTIYPAFSFPSRTPSWFAGHMAKSMKQLPKLLQGIDIVIEARDARLPLTSINGAFDSALDKAWGRPKRSFKPARACGPGQVAGSYGDGLRGAEVPEVGIAGSSIWEGAWTDAKGKTREKIVVYTKRDLAEQKYEEVSPRYRDVGCEADDSSRCGRRSWSIPARRCSSSTRRSMQTSGTSSSTHNVSLTEADSAA